jgi:SAM-dependent methyltransferase
MNLEATASPANGSAVKRLLLRGMPPATLRLLRSVRGAGLRALDPIDYASRTINNQRRLPPFHLRREVGDPSIFESSGAEFLAYSKLLCGLRRDERVLDIGCGCGLMALFLEEYLDEAGAYLGIDVQEGAIRWCQSRIGARSPNFKFTHLDVRNQRYNPRGDTASLRVPGEDGAFDFIIVKSVFTHLLQADVEGYLAEIHRLLSGGGRCLASWYLLPSPAWRPTSARGRLTFPYGNGVCRYESERSPETAVAYPEPYVRHLLDQHGLQLRGPVYRGTWPGQTDGLSTQDLTVIEKRP